MQIRFVPIIITSYFYCSTLRNRADHAQLAMMRTICVQALLLSIWLRHASNTDFNQACYATMHSTSCETLCHSFDVGSEIDVNFVHFRLPKHCKKHSSKPFLPFFSQLYFVLTKKSCWTSLKQFYRIKRCRSIGTLDEKVWHTYTLTGWLWPSSKRMHSTQ